ncbi:hypothetical protein RvY_09825 [Ramazzottius varieornatus]|uniref:Uncharacterized protein n=1 Tax=Ramazzottius varieornatus TaxID=947166 RepID=A0A1D1VAQ6_RAMVA|nr:hypothetical protein RvY_09825 [Ramazzottius varieornatus]
MRSKYAATSPKDPTKCCSISSCQQIVINSYRSHISLFTSLWPADQHTVQHEAFTLTYIRSCFQELPCQFSLATIVQSGQYSQLTHGIESRKSGFYRWIPQYLDASASR